MYALEAKVAHPAQTFGPVLLFFMFITTFSVVWIDQRALTSRIWKKKVRGQRKKERQNKDKAMECCTTQPLLKPHPQAG